MSVEVKRIPLGVSGVELREIPQRRLKEKRERQKRAGRRGARRDSQAKERA